MNHRGVNNSQYGTCWITDGTRSKKIYKGDTIPEGWTLGRVVGKRKKLKSRNCKQCGIVLSKIHKRIYCSNECRAAFQRAQSIEKVKEGKGGSIRNIKAALKQEHGNKCSECRIPPQWNGKALSLQVDHVNGNADDNSFKNLRLLCPNCHTQTPTFGSRNRNNTSKRSQYFNEYIRNKNSA